MNTGDWEAIENQDPLPVGSASPSVAAAAAGPAGSGSSETVVVIEPSAVIEEGKEGGSNSNGSIAL